MWCDPQRRRVQYRHIGGATRGMRVIWAIDPAEYGVRVSIVHDLALEAPIVRSWLGQWVVGHLFVHYIAGRTLREMKRYLEEGVCVEPSSPASDR
jgi:hypothetical protein